MSREVTITKSKTMTCGHQQLFSTPVPSYGEDVWCMTCNGPSMIPKYISSTPRTVAAGRRRRLKKNPRANNQHTKGRRLSDGSSC